MQAALKNGPGKLWTLASWGLLYGHGHMCPYVTKWKDENDYRTLCRKVATGANGYDAAVKDMQAELNQTYKASGELLNKLLDVLIEREELRIECDMLRAECDRLRDRIFEDTFVKSWDFIDAGPYNPRLIAECMKPFIVNDIPVSMIIAQNRVEFSGHNKDVSIRVVMMGMR